MTAETTTNDVRDLRRSPLHEWQQKLLEAQVQGVRAVAARELPFATMISLRAEPGGALYDRFGTALRLTLPLKCGQTAQSGDDGDTRTALWLGPDEWLVVSADEPKTLDDPKTLESTLQDLLGTDPGSVVDVSANRTVVELSGPSARPVLEKGCPADLHPRAFGSGKAISTSLGPVPLVLWQTGEQTYRLLPRSSYADYLARWLVDASAEFASPAVA